MTLSHQFIALLLGGGLVVLFFVCANRLTKRSHARFGKRDLEIAIGELVSPTSRSFDTWELFLSWPITDPYYESVRQRCITVANEHGFPPAGGYMSDEGLRQVEEILRELQERKQI